MGGKRIQIARAALVLVLPAAAAGQFHFKLERVKVEVHTFASQGFALSDHNNYLTMKTSRGSFALTDFGFNVSAQITDRLRVGAQLYDRNVGKIGNWKPSFDWAVIDYRARDWLGFRGGKVKTVFGLYNETRDIEFLHLWALLPQSTYSVDMRSDFTSHKGGEAYGDILLGKRGALRYSLWGGARSDDPEGGFRKGLLDNLFGPIVMRPFTGTAEGVDLRWTGGVNGLTLGASAVKQYYSFRAVQHVLEIGRDVDMRVTTRKHNTHAFYAQYIFQKLRLEAEYRKTWRVSVGEFFSQEAPHLLIEGNADWRYGYAAAAYRLHDRLELGTYHSRFYPAWNRPRDPPTGHVYDTAATVRFELNRHLCLKVEGHFLDGYSDRVSFRGFYPSDTPEGLQPKTKLLVVRLGYFF